MDITNVDEIITLSSDEENDSAKKSQLKIPPLDILTKQHSGNIKKNSASHNAAWLKKFETSGLNIDKNNKSEVQNNFYKKNKVNINKVRGKDAKEKKNSSSLFKSPEVVDLEECVEVIPKETNTLIKCTSDVGIDSDVKNHPTIQAPQTKINSRIKQKENSNKTEDNHNKNDCVNPGVQLDLSEDSTKINISGKIIQKSAQSNFDAELNNNSTVHNENKMHALNEDSDQHPDFFIEFVNFCGSLESVENDRMKLIKKLNKRCEEANPVYVRSQKFRKLIDKCREKLNENNLYVIAKEINDELSSRKKIKIETGNSNNNDVTEDIQDGVNNDESHKVSDKQTKKRTKIINKILNRLDKLGMRIHELEEAEVDLSDEEDSTYVQLQRYRERFVQIHKKLCEYTNEVSDANRVYCRKICFSGSKYPAINKCIENFLNKTKRFPDFSDIMKLLESQSSSLGLSSSRDSIRVLAIEIFQQVGVMLQQRRRYDLWDSFCGYLNDGQDPAENNPELEKIFKENFETRVKKEQDIFKYYTDIQCRERLEPEEIPDEEANESPLESGNEDEKEIEEIEESISKRLDIVIHREEFSSDKKLNDKESPTTFLEEGDEFSSTDEVETVFFDNEANEGLKLKPAKESKNNYKNCKSLKWRDERKNTQKDLKLEKFNERYVEKSDDQGSELKNNSVEITEIADNKNDDSKALQNKMEADQEDSDVECVCLTPVSTKEPDISKWKMFSPNQETENIARSEILNKVNKSFILQKALKRETKLENDGNRKRKRLSSLNKSDGDGEDGLQIVEIDVENENGNGKENKNDMALVYNVHYHQVEQSFESVFSKLSYEDDSDKEKNWGRGKVFRDLTNINRLMKSKEKKKNILGLFSQYHRGFREFEKPSWKKRYKTSYKFVGVKSLKCALNHEEKREESLGRGGRDSEKEIQNNSESGSEVSNFFSGNGSGREDDNNDNGENKKNGKIEKDDVDGKKFEDEEEEEKDEENEDEINGESKSERDSITHSNDCSVSVTSQECGNSSVETAKKNCDEFTKVCSKLKTEIVSKSEEPFKNVAQTVLREDSEVEAGNNLIFNDSDVAKGESEYDTIGDVHNKGCHTHSDKTEEIELSNAREGESLINHRLSESRSNSTKKVEQDENKIENVQKAEEFKHLDDENVCFVKKNEENIEAVESEETNASGEMENAEISKKENVIVEDIFEVKEEIKKLEGSCEKVNDCENIKGSNNRITESYKNRSESYVKEDYESLEECSKKLNVNYENSEESVRKIKEVNKNAEELRDKLEENDEIGKITIEEINEAVIKNVEENYERKCEENVFFEGPEVSVKIEMNDKDESDTGKLNVVKITEEAEEVIIKKEVVEEKSEETEEGEKVNVKEERTSEAEENVDEIFGENYTKEKRLECIKKERDDRVDNEIVEEVDLEKDLSIREKPNSETIEIDVKPPPIDPPVTYNKPPAKKDQCNVKLKSQDSLNNKNNDSEVLKPQTEKDSYVDYIVQKIRKRSNSTNSFTASDEERVKKFLLHSPSSISITPPRQLCMSKPPSQAALQALATLRGLKGISATRIQSRPKTEDDVILIGESSKRNAISETMDSGRKRKRRRSELPVISNVQSIMSTTPKIVTVQGNAPGFGSPPNPQYKRMNNGEQTHNSSSLRISNVWGGLPKNFIQSMSGNESVVPGCSFSQNNPTSGNLPRKKNTKKSVEYVVLE